MTNYEKGNITRLKNLLKQYRSHIITVKAEKNPYNIEITDIIEKVDTAISVLLGGL